MVILHRKLINIQYPTPIQYPRRASEAPLIVLDGCLEKSRERKSPNLPCGIYLLTFLKLMFHVFLWSWCLILPTIIGLIWLTCLISIFHELQVDSQWISAGTLSDFASDPDVSWCDLQDHPLVAQQPQPHPSQKTHQSSAMKILQCYEVILGSSRRDFLSGKKTIYCRRSSARQHGVPFFPVFSGEIPRAGQIYVKSHLLAGWLQISAVLVTIHVFLHQLPSFWWLNLFS